MTRATDDRGQALSVLVVLLVPVLIVMIGLVVDGGGRLTAERRAESVAADAARSGADAHHAGGAPGAKAAAEQHLHVAGVDGEVLVGGDQVRVHTTVTYRTVFLSVIGIDSFTADGDAVAQPQRVGP